MNPPKEKDTPKEPMALEKLIDDIYGKDVVSYAYASPAGTITKEQAIADIKAWAESCLPPYEDFYEVDTDRWRAYCNGFASSKELAKANIRSSK